MKFKVEVEIDWLDEESGSIDEKIQSEIASHILNRIQKEQEQIIINRINEMIKDRIDKIVDEKYSDLLTRGISVTDDWGNVTQQYDSIEKLIQAKFDRFLTESVDKSTGRSTTYGGIKRIDYVIDTQLTKLSEDFTKTAIETVKKKIEETLSKDLKEAMGDKILNLMEIDQLITKRLK